VYLTDMSMTEESLEKFPDEVIEAGAQAYVEWEASEDFAAENLVALILRRCLAEMRSRGLL
jgi:hypothetical protein